MQLKKRTKKRIQRMLCATLAAASLLGLWPGQASAAELGKISDISAEAEQPPVAELEATAEVSAVAKQLGTSASRLRFVRIYPACNTRNCVDIPGDRVQKDGTQGILYEAHFANPNQIFVLHSTGNGEYQIICLESGKILEVKDSSRSDCTPVVQRSFHENSNGKWTMIQNGDGTVSFRNVATGGMLNAKGGRSDSHELVQFYNDGTIANSWYLRDVGEDEVLCSSAGRYVRILYAINPGKCFDMPAEGILKNGTRLQLWDCYYGNQNQIHVMENTGFGWVIRNHQSGKVIEVRNSSHQNGAQVAQWDPHDSACARWDVLANIDGSVSFRNRESGKYLNLCGGGIGKNGQQFIQWFDDNSESMRFKVRVMGTADVLSAVYQREIAKFDIDWTSEHPLMPVHNTTGWSMRENGTWHYPSVGQKVFVSAEFLSPNTVANMLKERAYSPSTLENIEAVLAGEGSEEMAVAVLKGLGFKEIPGVGAVVGVLQTLLDIQEKEERDRFVDAVDFDARGQCSGVILYTYKTVKMVPEYSKVNGRWKLVQKIETDTSVDYGKWTGDNFADVCNLRLNGTSGTWHYCFK